MLRWMCGVTKLDNKINERIRGTAKVGEIAKNALEVVCMACDEKRGALRRKAGDRNESAGENVV